MLVSDIIPNIVSKLNDQSQAMYTNPVLLPHIADAWEELQIELDLCGVLVLEKDTWIVTLPIGQTSFVTAGIFPADLLEAQKLEEKLSGSADLFYPMTRRQWEPDILPSDSLRYWSAHEQDIYTVGATSIRDVKIMGKKSLSAVTATSSSLPVNHCKLFMIYRSAGLAAIYVGNNKTRGESLMLEGDKFLNKLTRINAKDKQGTRTRRRPFRLGRRGSLV